MMESLVDWPFPSIHDSKEPTDDTQLSDTPKECSQGHQQIHHCDLQWKSTTHSCPAQLTGRIPVLLHREISGNIHSLLVVAWDGISHICTILVGLIAVVHLQVDHLPWLTSVTPTHHCCEKFSSVFDGTSPGQGLLCIPVMVQIIQYLMTSYWYLFFIYYLCIQCNITVIVSYHGTCYAFLVPSCLSQIWKLNIQLLDYPVSYLSRGSAHSQRTYLQLLGSSYSLGGWWTFTSWTSSFFVRWLLVTILASHAYNMARVILRHMFTLFLQGVRLLPHRQAAPQKVPAALQGQLFVRWHVFLHEQITDTVSKSESWYATDLSKIHSITISLFTSSLPLLTGWLLSLLSSDCQ